MLRGEGGVLVNASCPAPRALVRGLVHSAVDRNGQLSRQTAAGTAKVAAVATTPPGDNDNDYGSERQTRQPGLKTLARRTLLCAPPTLDCSGTLAILRGCALARLPA